VFRNATLTLSFECLPSRISSPQLTLITCSKPLTVASSVRPFLSCLTSSRLLVSNIFLSSFIFAFKVWLVERSLRFLSCHVLFSSSFPVLSRLIFSLPFLLLHSCHHFMFVRHVLFHLMSFTVLSYFTVPFYRRLLYRYFLPRFIPSCMSVFQGTLSSFAPFCVSPIRI
jgi:hypothetical protein